MNTEIWMMLFGGLALLLVIGSILKGTDALLKRPYRAEERYGAVHAGGLDGIGGRKRLHLFLNREALIIKPWFKPALVIPFADIEEAESSWVFETRSRIASTGSQGMTEQTSSERSRDLENIRGSVHSGATRRQLMLHYVQGGRSRTACFEFRYGEEEDTDREPFYRCLQSLDRRLGEFRAANPANNAAARVDLRKSTEQSDDGMTET